MDWPCYIFVMGRCEVRLLVLYRQEEGEHGPVFVNTLLSHKATHTLALVVLPQTDPTLINMCSWLVGCRWCVCVCV